jgi:spore germination protein KC
MKEKTIVELEKRAEQRVKSIVQQAINTVQEDYQVDIFGFGEEIHRTDPKAWKEIENNWDQEFVDLPVNVKADVKIRRVGTVGQSHLEEVKE